ncbi:MAG: hypothetical protein AAF492_10155 [Verrucomicrobiota bacterium]
MRLAIHCGLLLSVLTASAGPVRLTDDGRIKRDVLYWPGTTNLFYSIEIESGRMKIVQWNPRGEAPTFLHPDKNISDRELAVAADGNTYVYNSITGNKGISSVIHLAEKNGTRKEVVESKGWSHYPAISPDGKVVLFVASSNDLKKHQVPEKKTDVLLDHALWPTFSPDGQKIVFASLRDADIEIYSMDINGSNQKRLTESRGIERHPSFSPDGSRIAFTSNRDGNFEIYVMQADGSNPRRVTNHPERDDFATWHPNGNQLVVVSERNGETDLYLYDVPR